VDYGKTYSREEERRAKKEFGLPEERKYPMPNASHARNAKARASQMEHQGKLSAADKKKIDTKADHILNK
jgi:2-hydroxychromene-2-carboxylate isomerase